MLDLHAQQRHARLQTVMRLIRVRHCRKQQRIDQRLIKDNAGHLLLDLQKAHVKGNVVPEQHRPRAELMEAGQRGRDGRSPPP